MKMTHKRILDIYKAGTTGNVIVEYFDRWKELNCNQKKQVNCKSFVKNSPLFIKNIQ